MKKSSGSTSKTEEVKAFIKELDHPFKEEVEAVRKIIKKVHNGIREEVKWKAPSFIYKGNLVTFNLWERKRVHLVFHNGAILTNKNGLLEGDYPDRRMLYFANMKDVKRKKPRWKRSSKNGLN
jgi:hypothetical protein